MRSLARGSLLAFGGVPLALWWSGFPEQRASPLLIFPVLLALVGIFDTARCMRKQWNFYHAGVLLLLYADLMALCLLMFILLYPYLPSVGRL
jgi:hypothetical protein